MVSLPVLGNPVELINFIIGVKPTTGLHVLKPQSRIGIGIPEFECIIAYNFFSIRRCSE